MKRLLVILLAIVLASCGNEKVAFLSPDEGKPAADKDLARRVSMQSILSGAQTGLYKEGEVIVKLKPGVRTASSLPAHQALGATVLRGPSLFDAELVGLPKGVTVRDAIIRYMQDPGVEYAEPNYFRSIRSTVPNDPLFHIQWDLRNTFIPGADLNMPSAWDIVKGNSGLVIAVLDTGIDYTHPDLAGNIWDNPGDPSCTSGNDNDHNGFIADCRGWNFVGKNNDPMDDEGHGTHVSGTVGAVGNNGLGIAGIMWNVKLMPLKILDNEGIGTVADERAAILYAIAKGAKVINASFAGGTFSNFEFEAISAANAAGILFVTAAGNNHSVGSNNDVTPVYPGNYDLPNIMSVAATEQDDRLAPFSNFGPATVHVAAPGVSILSTIPSGLTSSFCGGSPVAGYGLCDGTSMAAPHVTGVAGLLASYYKNFTATQLRETIIRYSDGLPALQGVIKSGGRINAYRAVSALLAPSELSADALSSSQVELAWRDSATGEDGFKIERKKEGSNFAEIVEVGANVTTFTDNGLNPSTAYTYRVRAFNTIPADSEYSNEVSATTLAGSGPTPVPASSGGGGCSVGTGANSPERVDVFLILIPMLAVMMMLRGVKKKK